MKNLFSWFPAFMLLAAAMLTACGGSSSGAILAASEIIDATGGTVAVTDPMSPVFGATIVVPPGAVAAPTVVTISHVVFGGPYGDNVLTLELGPAGTTFATPVTVTIPYLQQYLTDLGITDPATLHVVRRSGSNAPETLVTGSRDDPSHTITAETSGFSTFAVLGYSNASLSGTYSFSGYAFYFGWHSMTIHLNIPETPYIGGVSVPGLEGSASDSGTITFDGAGGYSFTQTSSEDGTTVNYSGSGTYSVAADGTLTIDRLIDEDEDEMGDIGNLSGGVLSGGSTFVAAATSGETQVLIGILRK